MALVLWRCDLVLALSFNLQLEHSGGQGSIPCRAPPFEHHDWESQNQWGFRVPAIPAITAFGANSRSFTFTLFISDNCTVFTHAACRAKLYAAWWNIPPYISRAKGVPTSQPPTGIFPDILTKLVKDCCGACSQIVYKPLSLNSSEDLKAELSKFRFLLYISTGHPKARFLPKVLPTPLLILPFFAISLLPLRAISVCDDE